MRMRKNIFNFWKNRHERFYKKKRWHLFLDIFFIAVMIILVIVTFRLFLYNPSFINMITVPDIPIGEDIVDKKEIKFEFEAEPLKAAVNFEEEIVFDIKYVNAGKIEINKVEFSFDLDDSNFKLISFTTEGDLETQDDVFIFENISPGETKEARLSIIWRDPVFNSGRFITASLNTKSVADKLILERAVNLPTVKINSQLNLEANLYYHSPQGDQLGIGPIPPVVGVPTKYWLIVKANNQGNNLSDLVFSAQLAPGVEFADEYSLLAGKFSYDSSRRRLIWQVDSLEASGGDYIANFAVNLIATADQIGKNALILNNLEYYADDDWTGVEIHKRLYNLDTSLPADRLNKGEGAVLSE
jgi:hypothetical protein